MKRLAWLALAIGCGGSPSTNLDATPTPTHALAMSDVSILLPLPADPNTPVLASITLDGAEPMMTKGLFGALVLNTGDIAPKTGPEITYEQMQIVALRIDLCDRSVVGPCPVGADGRLRVVLQPMTTIGGATGAQDIAVHAFYAIPAADLDGVIRQLRALAAIQDAPADGPLAVSPAAAAQDPDYLAALRALVLKYARASNLTQTTVMGQVAQAGAFEWHMRGFTNTAGSYQPIVIPGSTLGEVVQSALIAGGDITYNIDPVFDQPPGFALAVVGQDFDAAPPDQQMTALASLVAVENPAMHDAVDTQCIACHVAEFTSGYRAMKLGVDVKSVAGWYTTPRNTTVSSIADTDSRVVRAFGWAATFPIVSQRAANATAEVLDEIDARFPP